MPNLRCRKSLQLFAITESPNETNGLYGLIEFDDSSFNQAFDETEIDERLNDLITHLYGGGMYFEITDDMYIDGNLSIPIDDNDRLDITDLTEQINVDSEKSTCYVLVDGQCRDFCWVVAEVQGYVYTDSD